MKEAILLFLLFASLHRLPIPPSREILIVGDSEAATVCAYLNHIQKINDDVSCDYRGGTGIDDWSNHLLPQALGRWRIHHQSLPDTLIIFLGTNDLWRQPNSPNPTPIVALGRSVHQCIWVGPIERHQTPLAASLQAIISPCTWVSGDGVSTSDGVHPTRKAAISWLRRVWDAME